MVPESMAWAAGRREGRKCGGWTLRCLAGDDEYNLQEEIWMRILAFLGVWFFIALPTFGQANCSDGQVYDDGVFEDGDGLNPSTVARGGWLQSVESPSYPARLNAVCVCWARIGSAENVSFDLGVWNFTGGLVGALLGTVPNLQATNVPMASVTNFGQFYRYDISSANIVATGPVLVGPIWRTSSGRFYVCSDQTPKDLRLEYLVTGDPSGQPIGPANSSTLTYALGIRPVFGAAGACIPSDSAMCLNGGRFKVEATFMAGGQPQGTAHVVKLTDETGYLWFFNASNVEVVVKVINACSFNQRFWVYAGGLTDVNVVLKVTDTLTDTVKTYTNPQGAKFQPIQDSSAFATCQ
jgi:hypothetical protein